MTIYYSKSSKGFFDSVIHGDNIPTDSKEITPEYHQELIQGQASGKFISTNTKGKPILVDAPVLSAEEEKASFNANIIKQIEDIEANLQPRALRDMLISNDNTRLLALDTQIQGLRAQLK